MTYVIHCDFCGKRLRGDDYAEFEIHIERQSVPGVLDRKWAREVRPTRFFCVTSTTRDEANRMGLPLDSFEAGADCYERAIAAITGVATDRPDAGMEWRLVEVDPDRHKRNREQVRERSEAEARVEARQATDEQKDRLVEIREQRDVWAGMPRERRESLLFQVLGDERLILRELTSRMNAELGTPDHGQHSTVYQGHVRSLVMRMFHAGQLERAEAPFQNKPRWRYFRKRGLEVETIGAVERA